jgi:hypothetical protein
VPAPPVQEPADPAPAAAPASNVRANAPDQSASVPAGPAVVPKGDEVAPPSPNQPEEYRSWVMNELLSFDHQRSMDAWFEDNVSPFQDEMLPPDWEDLIDLLNKRRANLEAQRADG